ncbi:MAG TPA: hypothetical protein VIH57_06235 [Bacteroidales bacterium]
MKKFVLAGILLMLITLNGFSQIEKHTLLLGGNASLNFNDAYMDNPVFYANPNTGLFLTDRLCLGVSLPLLYTSGDLYWGLSPFGRYYFNPKGSRSLYLSASVGITSFLNADHTILGRALTLGIGHVWLLNKSVGFETEFQGSTDRHDLQAALFFGFQIYFNKSNE